MSGDGERIGADHPRGGPPCAPLGEAHQARQELCGAQIEMALSPDGPWIDAKSIVKVMATKATKDTVLHLRAEGGDATPRSMRLSLVERDFDEVAPMRNRLN